MATSSRGGHVYVRRFRHWRSGEIITVEKNGKPGTKAFRFPARRPRKKK
jgi:hypothetical protein